MVHEPVGVKVSVPAVGVNVFETTVLAPVPTKVPLLVPLNVIVPVPVIDKV